MTNASGARQNSAPYRVLMTCGAFEPGYRGGGPIRSVARIVDTAPANIEILLVTSDRDIGESTPYPELSGRWVQRGHARVFYLNTRSIPQWWRLWRAIRKTPVDLLYVNSLWTPKFSVLPILAALTTLISARQILIAPRGELSPGALSLKAEKKRRFLKLWVPVLRRLNAIWHASTPMEEADIRAVHPDARVEVVENQTALPAEPHRVDARRLGPAKMVFISRISAKKNLDLALAALGLLEQPVELDVYGPIEDMDYWDRCQRIIAAHPRHIHARYRGELAGAAVRDKFAEYDLFVFPTKGENFGHVIAESLSASCPVLCSDQTPWTTALKNGGGIVVDTLTPQAVAAGLSRVADMSPEGRLVLRRRAGEVYRHWRTNVAEENILGRVRQRQHV